MRVIWTRFLVVFAVAFVALPAQALTGTSYLCRMTGKVSESHCCAAKRAQVSRACYAQVQAPDCCELIQAHGRATAAATRTHSQDVPAAAMILAPAFALPARRPRSEASHESTVAKTHPPGPPRFLMNCTFLI
jgi:hypothetical protein